MAIYSTRSGTASQISPEENARINAQQIRMRQEEARSNANHQRLVNIGKFASVAIPTAGFGLAAAGAGAAGAAGAAAPTSGGYSSPGIFGGLFGGGSGAAAPVVSQTASKAIPWMRISELGAGLFTGGMGQRASGQAADRDLAYRQSADERTYQMLMAQEAQRKQEWADQQKAIAARDLADQEQVRLDRLEDARKAALTEGYDASREAARVPYRQAGQIALRDLLAGLR